ncbi:MAG TPA: aminotransferase class III-fold pyridoxal phosphate-dependent enzyme [Puia sp.]|nr:aminotransferase class III-fold pyridoxal phosphate-dependent enzyme [Puia sp.]
MAKHLINSISVCPDPVKIYPKMIRGKGACLYDQDGREYLDAVSGKAAVASIGHGCGNIADAVARQMKELSVFPTYSFESPLLEEYLEKLVDYSPEGFSKAWLMTSGSEAVENACKLAYQYHSLRGERQRSKFIGRDASYHGNSIFGLDIGGIKSRKEIYKPLLKGNPQIPAAHCYRCPFGLSRETCNLECAKSLEKKILDEGPETIAGFIFEPVSGAALGASPAPEGYLKEIRRICTQYGVLMIADEVMTGFGRIGYNFAVDHWGIIPDIIAAGKGIGSGYYPLSAIIAHKSVLEPLEKENVPFASLYSYACNLTGALVGSCVLDYMISNDLNANVQKTGAYLFSLLSKLLKHRIVGDVRGMGLLLGIELVADPLSKQPFPAELNVSHLLSDIATENGLLVYPCKGSSDVYTGDHILLTPPLILTKEQAERITCILDRSILQLMTYLQ